MPKSGHAHTHFSGSADTFQQDHTGTLTYSSFPSGWLDDALADPASTAPKPSAVVIKTDDAKGHTTNAVAVIPVVAASQGIYRPIDTSTEFYKTSADVRIDQVGDVDQSGIQVNPDRPDFLLCGCPVEFKDIVDTVAQVGFIDYSGTGEPLESPAFAVIASADTDTWHVIIGTTNVLKDFNTGIHFELGHWYGVETDLDVQKGLLHASITDNTTRSTLYNNTIDVTQYGAYDPDIDGVFNAEGYFESELSLVFGTDPTKTTPNAVVFDNIDTNSSNGNDHGFHGYDHGHDNAQWLNTILCNNG